MGEKTLNEYFYKTTLGVVRMEKLNILPLGSKGKIEINEVNKALDVADAEIKANKDAIHIQITAALTSAATIAVNWSNASVYTLTPAHTATLNASGGRTGRVYSIVITTSGAVSFTLTFGTAFKTTGTLATGTVTAKVFTINFVYDGTNFNEVSRTTAM